MHEHKDKLKSVLLKYAAYVEKRLDRAIGGEEAEGQPLLMDEVRTVNLLCVTYDRMEHKAETSAPSAMWCAGTD